MGGPRGEPGWGDPGPSRPQAPGTGREATVNVGQAQMGPSNPPPSLLSGAGVGRGGQGGPQGADIPGRPRRHGEQVNAHSRCPSGAGVTRQSPQAQRVPAKEGTMGGGPQTLAQTWKGQCGRGKSWAKARRWQLGRVPVLGKLRAEGWLSVAGAGRGERERPPERERSSPRDSAVKESD